jgi:hypothetical protein
MVLQLVELRELVVGLLLALLTGRKRSLEANHRRP